MKNNTSFIFSMIFGFMALGLVGCLNAQDNSLSTSIKNGAYLVDVRTPAEFEAGSVPGAVNIPLNEVADRLDEFKDKGEIIVFCRTGNRSGQAKNILDANNFKGVINGGSWQNVKESKDCEDC